MRKMLALFVLVVLAVGGASSADPGPNGNNNHGLCTAYFNGSANGQDHKSNAPPFVALAQEVGENDGVDNDDDGETDEEGEMADAAGIWDWCNDPENNPKGIGGQPDDPNTPGEDPNGGGNGNGGGKKKS
jgi:hypothetical protein